MISLVQPGDAFLIPGLCSLLKDAVDGGASVGFLAPLSMEDANQYWQQVFPALQSGLYLWVAIKDEKIVGSVQLALCGKQNGQHRAEIQKLFVLREYRGQGVSSKLMKAAENFAFQLGRSLLVLDTEAGSDAELIYLHSGWKAAGSIPDYAKSPNGELRPTVYYYKFIQPNV
ncbi:GNAT family N-acetyltransferase [Iodobacter fluviatilis]|uniref:Acetyltransferase n=1 Tax=Iodobacter fluviatilis TaxID=537 RepID=A0A377Q412_9NEIS|nr:GNAT family N-acetyltransferase [Iodobacter fluviatilis]TCU90481.1 acetyltransferase (GNAT) family protein [Iodobacter fluviatilis]STQ89508.1 Acetyltransferase [Iodobacter fluviatilis]